VATPEGRYQPPLIPRQNGQGRPIYSQRAGPQHHFDAKMAQKLPVNHFLWPCNRKRACSVVSDPSWVNLGGQLAGCGGPEGTRDRGNGPCGSSVTSCDIKLARALGGCVQHYFDAKMVKKLPVNHFLWPKQWKKWVVGADRRWVKNHGWVVKTVNMQFFSNGHKKRFPGRFWAISTSKFC
jgi:hypothetical protein